MTTTSSGKVVAGGALDNIHTGRDAAVFLSQGTGAHIATGKLFNFKLEVVFQKKWLWGINAELPAVAPPEPRGLGDLSSEGAQLELTNPSTAESAIIDLPADHWQALGRVYATRGFKYLDPDHSVGPCHKVLFQPGKKLTVSCSVVGARHPISLDEGAQGSFEVKLRFTNGDVYCFSTAGGEVRKDFGIAAPSPRGLFSAMNGPAPALANCE